MKVDTVLHVVTVVLLAVALYQLSVLSSEVEGVRRSIDDSSRERVPATSQQRTFSERTRNMPVAAVTRDRRGVLGNMSLKVIPGNNNVLVDTNPFLEAGLQYSLNTAVTVAKQRTNYSYNLDFIYSFRSDSQLLGGESAGAAATVLAIAAITDAKVREDVVMTGTVTPDGSIGRVGGVMEKAKAVGEAGYDLFLVPEGQATVTYYRTKVREDVAYGIPFVSREYVPERVDLREKAEEQWGLTVKEVSTVREARRYALK